MTVLGQFKLRPTVVLAMILCGGTGALAINGICKAVSPPRSRQSPPIDPALAGSAQGASPRPVKVPSEVSGRLLGVFFEIGPYDMADENDIIIVDGQRYRRLCEGDSVKEGQLLAQVNDTLACDDLDLVRTRIVAAEAELLAAQYAKEGASLSYHCMTRPQARVNICPSQEDVLAAKLACDRYEQEVAAKKANLIVLQAKLRQAQRQSNLHEIRSPVDGVIKTIHVRKGEAVKQFDTVLEILPADEDR